MACREFILTCLAAWLSAEPLWAATQSRSQNSDSVVSAPLSTVELDGHRPSLMAIRVDAGPEVDGRLDDEAWHRAPAGTPLYEAYEHPGRPMTERTEFRVVYDDQNLYGAPHALPQPRVG